MKKSTKVLGAVAAIGASTTLVGGAVHADSVSTDKPQTSEVQKLNAKPVSVADAQNKVNSDQSKVNADKQQVATDQSNVNKDQSNVDKYSKDVQDSKTQTPAVKDQISKTNADIQGDQSKISADQNTISKDQSKVNADQSRVTADQTSVTAAQDKVNGAQDAVNHDNQRINDIHHAQQIADQAKQNVANDQQQVANAQSNVSKAQSALIPAQNAKDQAGKLVSAAQSALTAAQNKEQADQNEVNSTQDSLNNVTAEINSRNVIDVPAGYTDSLLSNGSASDQQNVFSQGMNDPANTYHSSPEYDYNVDPTHLTPQQQRDLATWIAQLINPIREKLGNAPLTVNQSALDFANAIAQNYNQDNWSIYKGHDVPAIEKAAKQYGLDSTAGNIYEDASTTGLSGSTCTMNDLRANIYGALKNLLFSDVAHAQDVSGYNFGNNKETSYFGFSIDNMGQFHFEQVHPGDGETVPSDIEDASKFNVNNNIAVPADDLASLEKQQANLQQQLSTEQSQLAQDKQAVTDAQNKLNNANAALNSATNAFNAAKQGYQDAQTALTNAQNKLAQDQATLKQAQEDVQNAPQELQQMSAQLSQDKQALTDAQNNLNAAKTKLQNDQTTLQNDQNILNAAKAQLAADQQKLQNDQNTLKQLQQQLSDYQNAPQLLAQAKQQLATDQAKLAADQAQLATDEDALAQDTTVLNNAKANAAKEAQAEANREQAQRAKNSFEIGGSYVLGSGSREAVAMPTVKADVVPGAKEAGQANQHKRALPDTGDAGESGVLDLLGAALLTVMGTAGYRRKRHD